MFAVDLCFAGSEWNDTACVDCEINWYKSADGNVDPCLPCPDHELTLHAGANLCSKNIFCTIATAIFNFIITHSAVQSSTWKLVTMLFCSYRPHQCLIQQNSFSNWEVILDLPTKLWKGNIFTSVCLSFCSMKVPCDHNPRCIGPHDTWDPSSVQGHPPTWT